MGVLLTGSGAGSLWVKLGHIEGWTLDVESMRGGTATTNVLSGAQVPTRVAQLEVDYAGGTAEYGTIDGLGAAASSYQSTLGSMPSTLQQLAQSTLVDMANADTPLSSKSVLNALKLVIQEMVAASATINASTVAVGSQTSVASPTGTPKFVWSAKDGAGRALQYTFPEKITVAVTSDAQSGATLGQEPYSVTGQNAQQDFLAFDWLSSKYGSGATSTGNLIDPMVSNTGGTSGNMLVNGNFATATTANNPDNFALTAGTAGSTILVSTSTNGFLTGAGSLEMVSDGTTNLGISQAFNTASTASIGVGGTPAALQSGAVNNAQFAVYVPLKLSATTSAGVLTVDMVDGSGTVIADDQSTNNSFTIDLTAIGDTNFHVFTGVFRMPAVLPASTPYKLRIRQSTPVTSGKNVFLSCIGFGLMQQFYAGGPYFIGFRGATAVNASGSQPDSWTFAVTNTSGALQKAVWRAFNPPSLTPQTPGLIVPAGGSPTIADALVA